MDYAPVALEKEPGMQTAFFWTIVAADGIGNSIARDKALDNAKIELTDEEYVSADALRKNYTIHSLQSKASFSYTTFAVN